MNKIALWMEKKLAAMLLRLLRRSIRFHIINRNPDDQMCVYMFWHRNLMLLALHRLGSPIAVMVSASQDGELIAGPISELGLIPVRGSSSRQGSAALKEMIRLSKNHQLAITPDGPKGPPQTIHPGVFQIALMGNVPIIPVVGHASREWVFNSWDRFRFPKPFSRISIAYGEPFFVKTKEDISKLETTVPMYMAELENQLTRQ